MCQMYVRGALSARQTGHLSLLDNPVTASAQWGRVGGAGGLNGGAWAAQAGRRAPCAAFRENRGWRRKNTPENQIL